MSLFAFHCRDAEGSPAIRAALLGAHLAHIKAHMDCYAVAGPLREAGSTVGSLLVIKAASLAEARQRFEADPYWAGGVWANVCMEEFAAVAGEWVGGAAWEQGLQLKADPPENSSPAPIAG